MSGQLELAELDDSRARLAEAQVRALRAQISPHFVFNARTAIASFVRTEPTRAHPLGAAPDRCAHDRCASPEGATFGPTVTHVTTPFDRSTG